MAFSSSIGLFAATTTSSLPVLQNGHNQDFQGVTRGTNSTSRQSARPLRIWAAAGPPKQGRGYNAKKASAQGVQKRMSNRDLDQEGWVQVAVQDELVESKNKAIIHDNVGYVLVRRGSLVYTIKANCTTCQFPMIDGKVDLVGEGDDLTIECPLCHSKFSVVDGDCAEFCPKDGPMQWFVGTLKSKTEPVAADVYQTRVSNSGRVYVKFVGI